MPKSGSSGIREHGRLNVQRFLGLGSSGIREHGFFRVHRFGEEINSPPPGLASATVPPVMDARVATIRGRMNSLVILFNVEDIVTHP